jgi:transcriptional regulator with XRE-family HTH domain
VAAWTATNPEELAAFVVKFASQVQAAEYLEVSSSAVSRWLSGDRSAHPRVQRALAERMRRHGQAETTPGGWVPRADLLEVQVERDRLRGAALEALELLGSSRPGDEGWLGCLPGGESAARVQGARDRLRGVLGREEATP